MSPISTSLSVFPSLLSDLSWLCFKGWALSRHWLTAWQHPPDQRGVTGGGEEGTRKGSGGGCGVNKGLFSRVTWCIQWKCTRVCRNRGRLPVCVSLLLYETMTSSTSYLRPPVPQTRSHWSDQASETTCRDTNSLNNCQGSPWKPARSQPTRTSLIRKLVQQRFPRYTLNTEDTVTQVFFPLA